MTNCNNGSARIYVSGSETKNAIIASNNRSRYYAELAKQYKDEAKGFRDDAQYYAEQNSDVSKAYVDEIDVTLRNLIATKQNAGSYALTSDIPVKLSDLTDDLGTSPTHTHSQYLTSHQSLTTLADYNLSNLTSTGKTKLVTIAHELDWANAIEITTTSDANARTYTCLADGIVGVSAVASGGSAAKAVSASVNFDTDKAVNLTSISGLSATTAGCGHYCSFLAGQTANYMAYASGGSSKNNVAVYFIPYKKV